MRKIILGIGTVATILVPTISVVSCGGFTSSAKLGSRFQDVNIIWQVEGEKIVQVTVETNKDLTDSEVRDYVWTALVGLSNNPLAEDFVLIALDDFKNNFESEMNDIKVVHTQIEHIDQPETIIHAPLQNTQTQTQNPHTQHTATNSQSSNSDVSEIITKEVRNNWDSFDSGMKGYLTANNNNVMPSITATVYKTKYINFAFDNDLNIPEYVASEVIDKFFDQTTWGYGLLTTDTILITNKKMGSAGWGGTSKDMMVACEPWKNSEIDETNLQNMFDTLRHEYGHHETLSSESLIGGSTVRTNNLINNHMPNYQVLDTVTNHPTDVENLKTQIMSNVNATGADTLVSDIYTAPMFTEMKQGPLYSVSKDFSFNLAYHYGPSEVLNRTMNILEASSFTSAKYIAGSPIIMADNMGYYFSDSQHSQKLLDPTTGQYDQTNTNKVIELWKDYVYGYGSNKLVVDSFNVSGYVNQDIDFAKVKTNTSRGLVDKIVPLEKAPSHFISSRTSFDTEPTWDTSYTAYGGVVESGLTYYPVSQQEKTNPLNQPHFYQDTNSNGQLDDTDLEVMISYEWNPM